MRGLEIRFRAPVMGQLQRNPDLGATFRRLAKDGAAKGILLPSLRRSEIWPYCWIPIRQPLYPEIVFSGINVGWCRIIARLLVLVMLDASTFSPRRGAGVGKL